MRYLLVATLLLFVCKLCFGQTQLETPIVTSVSYNEVEKKYDINWYTSDYNPIDSFNILVFNGNDNTDFDILASIHKQSDLASYDYFIDPVFTLKGKKYDLNKDIVYFVVQACPISSSVKASGLSSWSLGNAPCNIVLSADFDSTCYYTIHLNWNKFKGWASDVKQYYTITCRDEEGNSYKINPDGSNRLIDINELLIYADTSINIPDVKKKDMISHNFGLKPSKKYFFQVSVANVDGYESLSNVLEVSTKVPDIPGYIETYGTTTSRDSVIAKFFAGPGDYSRYAFFRSESYSGGYECIDTVTFQHSSAENVISFVDRVKALEKPYFYKVQLLNNCKKNGVVLKESGAESSIIFTVKPVRNDVQLSWTEFKGFSNFHYLVHRVAAGAETSETFNSSQTSNTESLNLLPENGTNIAVQFWVEAIRDDENVGGKATSNVAIFTVAKNLIMQEYFTPNGDGKNDVFFVPLRGLQAQEFKLIIYDRWGMKVFETSDPSEVWNGRYNNSGNMAPQGGYIYYFKIKLTNDDPVIEQKGSFILMLPK
jgi:gliding motility-associated-like protein